MLREEFIIVGLGHIVLKFILWHNILIKKCTNLWHC